MKALVGAFNQEKALVGAFSVIVQPVVEPMELYTALQGAGAAPELGAAHPSPGGRGWGRDHDRGLARHRRPPHLPGRTLNFDLLILIILTHHIHKT